MKEKTYISRKDQAILTKKKIFDTTVLLIKKKGYNKITIREICQTAEISVGTFYLYFLSKDDILLDIYRKLLTTLSEISSQFNTLPCTEQILQIVSYFLEQLQNTFDKDLIREIFRINLAANQDPLLDEDSAFFHRITEIILQTTNQQKTPLSFAPADLAQKIVICIQGYLFHWLLDDSNNMLQLEEECIQTLRQILEYYLP